MVYPAANIFCGQVQIGGQWSQPEPHDDRNEEHDCQITRNVLHLNMNDEARENAVRLAARRRLKAARTAASLTVDELAQRVERSPSSVRAHENGQNGISRAAASLYAGALGITPSWLLWGDDRPEGLALPSLNTATRQVDIIGRLAGDVWLEGYESQRIGHVVIAGDEFQDFELQGFIVGRKAGTYRKGDYVVVAPPEVGMRAGDHVVVRLDEDGRTKLNLYEIERNSAGLTLRPLLGGRETLGVRRNWSPLTAANAPHVTIVGPVVAYGGRDRPEDIMAIRQENLRDIVSLG